MSNSIIFSQKFITAIQFEYRREHLNPSFGSFVSLTNWRRQRFCGMISYAKKRKSDRRPWWQKFFFDNDDWFDLKDDDMLGNNNDLNGSSEEGELSDEEKFEAWKTRAEVITELREAQEDMQNAEGREWEDWIGGDSKSADFSRTGQDWEDGIGPDGADVSSDSVQLATGKDMAGTVRDLIIGSDREDEILYEDRIFRYASSASAKFFTVLLIIPWTLDFVVHDYVLMPFLDRYVKTVPLAAEFLDVRKSQKLEMVKTLRVEKARYRFEAEIGRSPSLSDEELWWELRHKALELRDEWRLENRKAFANILSDMIFGFAVFIILYFNQSRVALMKFTGYKIVKDISDTGKAFLIILITDIFLGYHSESGWQTLIEIIFDHYGLEVDHAATTIFVSFVPVVIDACVKLWLFKFLPRLSPNVANIFREMKRH